MMNYKGYFAKPEYDEDAGIFFGRVLGINDIITFQGTTVSEIEKAFRESIDDYLAWCEERNEAPNKVFSGKFGLRLSPELHAKATMASAQIGVSLNDFVISAIEHELSNEKTIGVSLTEQQDNNFIKQSLARIEEVVIGLSVQNIHKDTKAIDPYRNAFFDTFDPSNYQYCTSRGRSNNEHDPFSLNIQNGCLEIGVPK